jgi:hypothetical protein
LCECCRGDEKKEKQDKDAASPHEKIPLVFNAVYGGKSFYKYELSKLYG